MSEQSVGKLGILGGTFNPPHIAHLIVAESVRDQSEVGQGSVHPGCDAPSQNEH